MRHMNRYICCDLKAVWYVFRPHIRKASSTMISDLFYLPGICPDIDKIPQT